MADSPSQKRPLWHPLHWPVWLGMGIFWLVVQLPYAWQMRIGRGIGRLAHKLLSNRRKVVAINLQLCFPTLSDAERDTLTREHFASLGIGILEIGQCWWSSNARLQPMAHYHGLEHVEAGLSKGKGVILLSAHFTSLEIGGRLFSFKHPISAMYRPHKHPVLNWAMSTFRSKIATVAIPRDDVRGMVKELRANHMVWYAADQSKRFKYTTIAPFFDEPAVTNTATSRFAKLTRATVVPFFTLRRETGDGYDLHFLPPPENFPSGDDVADAVTMNNIIAEVIRKAPAQYLWIHKRFKNRQPEYPNPY